MLKLTTLKTNLEAPLWPEKSIPNLPRSVLPNGIKPLENTKIMGRQNSFFGVQGISNG
jgi:hypothetical protein